MVWRRRKKLRNFLWDYLIKGKEIKDQEKIMKNLYQLDIENLFSNDVPIINKGKSNYLKKINLPKFLMEERELCESEGTKKEVEDALNKTEINKTPGNDGLTNDVFGTFWLEIKSPLQKKILKKVF